MNRSSYLAHHVAPLNVSMGAYTADMLQVRLCLSHSPGSLLDCALPYGWSRLAASDSFSMAFIKRLSNSHGMAKALLLRSTCHSEERIRA
jgi:hypothetical protein